MGEHPETVLYLTGLSETLKGNTMRDLQTIVETNNERVREMALARRLAWERELADMHRKADAYCRELVRASYQPAIGR